MQEHNSTVRICDLDTSRIVELAADPGLRWRVGPFQVCVRTRLADVVKQIARFYQDFEIADDSRVDDFDIAVISRLGRRTIYVDGRPIEKGLSPALTYPSLEWTFNLCVFRQAHQFLLVHAAVVERDGDVLVMPGTAGSSKSTLCALLIQSGWRLLSDEVALVDPATAQIFPVPRPISLKGESIDVIKRRCSTLAIGPTWRRTPKGDVALVLPPSSSVARSCDTARARWIVFPSFWPRATMRLEHVSRAQGLVRCVKECFNFTVLGATGFQTLADLVESCECFDLFYGSSEDGLAAIEQVTASKVYAS